VIKFTHRGSGRDKLPAPAPVNAPFWGYLSETVTGGLRRSTQRSKRTRSKRTKSTNNRKTIEQTFPISKNQEQNKRKVTPQYINLLINFIPIAFNIFKKSGVSIDFR
jgi:hypothetical protein